ncbi:MAG TPA: GDSL-type esterase/lipase family protein [Blastocatellia bacterium]|nr:GDSL-type esterase/lipase family protein [Blastocatellia bacterium]
MLSNSFTLRAFAWLLLAPLTQIVSFDQPRAQTQGESKLTQPLPVARPERQQQITISNPSEPVQSDDPQPPRNIGAFFDKLRAGKAVTVAYLGGSVISGLGASNAEKTSYRALVTNWIRKKYPKAEIQEINAAVGGTGSLYGALRARRDVIAYKPDLVFIDLATNDAGEDEGSVKKAVEGLLRQLLVVPQPPEVVMLHATTARKDVHTDWYEAVSSYYQIPSINLQTQTWAILEGGTVKSSDFWKDGLHPSDSGHKIYADLITNFLAEQEKLKATPIMRNLPTPLISDEMNYGEFKAVAEIKHNPNWKTELSNNRNLPTALLVSDKAGSQIEYYFEGTVIGLSLRMGPDCGIFEVLVDGRPAPAPLAKVDGYDHTHHIGTRIIAGGLGPGEHKLTIRVTSERNSKSTGNYVRLGYLLVGGTRPERL